MFRGGSIAYVYINRAGNVRLMQETSKPIEAVHSRKTRGIPHRLLECFARHEVKRNKRDLQEHNKDQS